MRTKLPWIILFSYVFTLGGCSHVAKVPPPANDADTAGWNAYYEDQFKALQKDVPAPEEDASNAQRIAYEEAKTSFETKNKIGLILGGFALLIGTASLIATLGQM